MLLRVAPALLLAGLAFAALPSAALAMPEPYYCWTGIAGSECGVQAAGCTVAVGDNVYTETAYAYARCTSTPAGPCFVYAANNRQPVVDCAGA